MKDSYNALPDDMKLAIKAAFEKKAEDLLLLDVRQSVSFTSFFVICSGHSDRQVQVIADHIEQSLKEQKVKAFNIEGYRSGNWILMDYADFLIHVFLPETRAFYNLEGLWHDGIRIEIPGEIEGREEPDSH
jgi:ribosome-associated protein